MTREFIGFYNVENLFPPDETGGKQSGLKEWNQQRYLRKIHKIARVFELMKHYKHEIPMIMGLAEINSKSVLDDLLAMPVFNSKYAYIHYDSMDERGMDVALLYHRDKIEISQSRTLSFTFEIEDDIPDNYDTTRDVLQVSIRYKNTDLQIFTVHLPSKREKNINAPKRREILDTIRTQILDFHQNDACIVFGDFNENPDENNMQSFSKNLLHNPFLELLHQGQYSVFHKGKGLLFDQCLLSASLFNKHSSLQFQKASVFNVEELYNRDKQYHNQPYRTYAGTRYLGGYSDHFPIMVEFVSS